MCGDNAFPKAVKEHVNGAVKRLQVNSEIPKMKSRLGLSFLLQGLEEDTEIIGENFTMHFTKYAKRPIINELPRNYINRMAPKGRRSRAGRKKKPANNDCIPETVEVNHQLHSYPHPYLQLRSDLHPSLSFILLIVATLRSG